MCQIIVTHALNSEPVKQISVSKRDPENFSESDDMGSQGTYLICYVILTQKTNLLLYMYN